MASCETEKARIKESYARRQNDDVDWKPIPISDDCLLHHFINGGHWPESEKKPFASALNQRGMSVVVSGPLFGTLTERCLREAILQSGVLGLEGAVCFTAKDVRNLGYEVWHDPNEFFDERTGRWEKQSQNHAEIICKKDTSKKREALRELCQPSLTPTKFREMAEY